MTPVLGISEIVANEHFLARRTFMQARHPQHGEFRQLAPVLAGNTRECAVHEVRPAGVTDTDAVFLAAGFSAAEIAALRAAGAVE